MGRGGTGSPERGGQDDPEHPPHGGAADQRHDRRRRRRGVPYRGQDLLRGGAPPVGPTALGSPASGAAAYSSSIRTSFSTMSTLGRSPMAGTLEIASATSWPSVRIPQMGCFPFHHAGGA